MKKGRLEAFSDGVLAIIITIMVLEIKVPHGETLKDLFSLLPVLISYALSFLYVGIYWNNHHHMLHTVNKINGQVLWANLHLLFWLSLIPFATRWAAESDFAALPMAMYGFVLLFSGAAYTILQLRIIKIEGKNSVLAKAIGNDLKGKLSVLFYSIAIISCLYDPRIAEALYMIVAMMWLIPDKRIEKVLTED